MAKLTLPPGELLRPGHAACPGCGPALAMRLLLKGLGTTVALLSFNSDFGKSYVKGFKAAIKGTNIKLVAEQTHEQTDPNLKAQITTLAASNWNEPISFVGHTAVLASWAGAAIPARPDPYR